MKEKPNSTEKRILGRTGLEVSIIGLGTTRIGYPYGIGDRNLLPEKEAVELLRNAYDMGINFFDTARLYGRAEELIGKSGIGKNDDVVIATKCGSILDSDETISDEDLEKEFRRELEESLRFLKMDHVSILQIHGGSEKQIKNATIFEITSKFKEEGKTKFVGISVRGEETALAAINSGAIDTIQIAYNILDQRMAGKVIDCATDKNIGIIARSALLKGALTDNRDKLDSSLSTLKERAEMVKAAADKLGTDLPSLALRFVMTNKKIHTTLVGTDSITHLNQAVAVAKKEPLAKDIMNSLLSFSLNDQKQIDPKFWRIYT